MSFKMRSNKPTTPCLATVIDDSGQLCPIIPGMALFIVEDPEKPSEAIPFVLAAVSRSKITLRLKTADGAIQDYEYKLTSKQLKNPAAVQRHKKNAS